MEHSTRLFGYNLEKVRKDLSQKYSVLHSSFLSLFLIPIWNKFAKPMKPITDKIIIHKLKIQLIKLLIITKYNVSFKSRIRKKLVISKILDIVSTHLKNYFNFFLPDNNGYRVD